MKHLLRVFTAFILLAVAGLSNATVLGTWDLTNKSPGALSADYGLRINQTDAAGVDGSSASKDRMIFDFERAGHGVQMQLIDAGGGALEFHLSGTAYGAMWDGISDYSSEFAGTYQIDFIWKNVIEDPGVYKWIAEDGIPDDTSGAGTGTVEGITAGTGWMSGSTEGILSILDWSGVGYQRTLDIWDPVLPKNPDASGWITHTGSAHNGDFGFSMVAVPAPGGLLLLGLGLFAAGAIRRSVR